MAIFNGKLESQTATMVPLQPPAVGCPFQDLRLAEEVGVAHRQQREGFALLGTQETWVQREVRGSAS